MEKKVSMDELLDNILFTEKEREKLQIPLVKLEDGLDGLFDETNGYIVYLDQFEKAIEVFKTRINKFNG